MKTISRQTVTGLVMAIILALGAVTGFAQDPTPTTAPAAPAAGDVCKDPDLTPASEKVTKDFTDYAKLSDDDKQKAIENADAFAKKYAACESAKALVDYVNQYLPGMKTALEKARLDKEKARLLARFDNALKAKQFDEVYASGKEILQKYPDEFRPAEIVLGSIGYDEAFKGNNKYNDDTLKFARQSIADLEANKKFEIIVKGKPVDAYGLSLKDSTGKVVYAYSYDSRQDAIGWMNLYIGYITQVAQKNKAAAAPFLFKASQATSGSAKIPIPYELIGAYYFEELNKLVEQVKVLEAAQSDTDTPELRQQKIDEIKAKVALVNGTAERAMDAYSRAFTLGNDAAYKAVMKKNVEDAYKLRFAKTEGVDAWIAGVKNKPFPNPTTPVTPISDAPAPATTTSTAPPATTSPSTTTKPPPTTPVKTTTTTPSPTAKPATGAKPQAKKKVAKRKRA